MTVIREIIKERRRLRTEAVERERYIAALELIVRRLREAIRTHRAGFADPQNALPRDKELWGAADA